VSGRRTSKPVVVGGVEPILLLPWGVAIDARVDTGARTSSIDARGVAEFDRGGEGWVGFGIPGHPDRIERRVERVAVVKSRGGGERRPVVSLEFEFAGVRLRREFTLADRGGLRYGALLGRNALRGVAVVDLGEAE